MAQTMMYTCDLCKNSKSEMDLARLDVKVISGIRIKDVTQYSGLRIDICKDCLKKKGFIVEAKTEEEKAEEAAKNKRTLEDKIFDILEDLGVAFIE